MRQLRDTDTTLQLLQGWVDCGWLRPLDVALARMLGEEAALAGEPASPLLLLLVALTSHQVGRGHVCLDLAQLVPAAADALLSLPPGEVPRSSAQGADEPLRPGALLAELDEADWQAALRHPLLLGDAAGNSPLVRQQGRLYLRRYWCYEQTIAAAIRARLARPSPLADTTAAPARALAGALGVLFPAPADAVPDWQCIACALAAYHRFAIITGGPGTGKTTTVVRLLAALQSVASQQGDGGLLRVRLAAPTGKAAARLSESISGAVGRLPLDELPGGAALAEGIPTRVTTLHRLLGSRPGSRGFRHHAGNPLALDLLVVDEASMVDVEMMAALLQALPDQARLVLLGDKDQLASVDAGAVLGELCQRAERGGYRSQTVAWLQQIAGTAPPASCIAAEGGDLDQAVVMLRISHRFDGARGIGQLAARVNAGELDAAAARPFREGQWADVHWRRLPRERALGQLTALAVDGVAAAPGHARYLEVMQAQQPAADAAREVFDAWAQRVLTAFAGFQLLCAVRGGAWGVDALNAAVAATLQRRGLIERADGWYPGRPVLVTRNDYNLGLMNGDIGVTLALPSESEPGAASGKPLLRVAFPAADGGVHWIAPGRLQAIDTVYAMTVHKSQGSEFGHACLVLPDTLSPVLTRELVYTGITRARDGFSLALADESVLYQAVQRRVTRSGGLGDLLGLTAGGTFTED